MLALWLTIGLPIYAAASGTAGGEGAMRDVFFDSQASAANGNGGTAPLPGVMAAAAVDPTIVREVRLERLRAQTVHAAARERVHTHAAAPRHAHDGSPGDRAR